MRATLVAGLLVCCACQPGCTGRAPHEGAANSAAGSSSPAVSPTGPTQNQSVALSQRFSWNGGSFDYPADWRLSRFDAVSSFTYLVAVLSNEPVHDPCSRTPTSVSCGEPLSHLGRGGVLVTWTQFGMAGIGIGDQPGTPATVGGRAARVLVTNTPISGCADIPGTATEVDAAVLLDASGQMWQMRACIADPGGQQAVKTALAMFDSVRLDPAVWK